MWNQASNANPARRNRLHFQTPAIPDSYTGWELIENVDMPLGRACSCLVSPFQKYSGRFYLYLRLFSGVFFFPIGAFRTCDFCCILAAHTGSPTKPRLRMPDRTVEFFFLHDSFVVLHLQLGRVLRSRAVHRLKF